MIYTTQSRIESFLGRELTDDEEEHIDETIISVSDYVSAYCGRIFQEVTDDENDLDENEALARYFDGNGKKELYIDDFTSLTKVTLLDSQGDPILELEDDADWILNPPNKDVKSSVYLRSYRFSNGVQNVEIEAAWGSGLAPAGVITAATQLAGKILQKNANLSAGFKSESIEGYSYTLQTGGEIDSDMQGIMDSIRIYKKFTL